MVIAPHCGHHRLLTLKLIRPVRKPTRSALVAAIATMRRYDRFRVPYFQALLSQARKQTRTPDSDRQIMRRPGNPMLRYVGGADQPTDRSAAVASASLTENSKL